MDDDGSGRPPLPSLPRDLLLPMLSLLPPYDLALSGRLACKDAAQRFQGPQHCTAFLGQPLPSHVLAGSIANASSSLASSPTPTTAANASASVPGTWPWFQTSTDEALRQLTFRRKLILLSRAAASGCEANVEFALQLLQPHVLPEVLKSHKFPKVLQSYATPVILQSNYCYTWLRQSPDAGSIAVASGLAHMLPSLAQCCPALLDPARTLEAAAKHCDLAGLQAAWEAVGQRLRDRCEGETPEGLQGFWKCMLAAAAGSSTPDAVAKMEWVLGMSGDASDPGAVAQSYGAAAASGDLARVQWVRERGVGWGAPGALEAVVERADLGCIQRMVEAESGYLPPAHDKSWARESVVFAAAAAPRDSAAKLRWLAGRGAVLALQRAVMRAAEQGDLEAVQLLVGHWRARHGAAVPPPYDALNLAAASGSVPTAKFLLWAGCALPSDVLIYASIGGHLPMVRWLTEAGCVNGWERICDAVGVWPKDSAADGERLLEALRVLAEVVPPDEDMSDLCDTAVFTGGGRWWAVGGGAGPEAGCEATLQAFVATDAYVQGKRMLQCDWYADAAGTGDRGTLAYLQRLGVPLGQGVIAKAVNRGAPCHP